MRPNILHLLSAIAFLRVPLLSFQNQKKKILQISLQFCNTEKNSERFEIFSKLEGWIKAMYRELLSHEIDWVRKPQWEKKDLSSESSEIPFLCVDFIEESDFPSYLLCSDSDSPRFLVGLFRYPSGRKSHGKIHVVAHADVLEPPKGLLMSNTLCSVLSNMPLKSLCTKSPKKDHCLVKSESIKEFKIAKSRGPELKGHYSVFQDYLHK